MQTPLPPPAHSPRPPYSDPVDHATEPGTHVALDRLYIRNPGSWLVALLAAYLTVGTLFALRTPAWQAPDEPAHYNYIAHIATTGRLPVLQAGDFDPAHLAMLLENRFPRKLTTATLRYESYQPPLYYLLATPIYRLSNGNLQMLRLLNVFLGGVSILLLYACLSLVFPGKTLIPLGAAAFSALLPMHVAMNAAVNNDGAAHLLLMATMLLLLRRMRDAFYGTHETTPQRRRSLLWLGVLLGLGLVTKIYAYLLLPIVLVVLLLLDWLRPRSSGDPQDGVRLSPSRSGLLDGVRAASWVLAPALLIAAPMWVRNALLYGPTDLLGLSRHDQIVVGQVRTAEWIATHGWMDYAERAISFTFRSFWGVFGWMGAFMDDRIYTALLFFTGVIFLGLLWATVRFISGGADTDMNVFQLTVLLLFGVILLAVFTGYVGYNLKFMQHQGRYFFWGLLPISTIIALGWREVLQPLQGAITGLLAAVLALAIALVGTVNGDLNKWTLLSVTVIALVLLCQPLLLGDQADTLRWLPGKLKRFLARPLPARLLQGGRALVWALPFILLLVLNLMIPSLFIVPQLAR